MSKEKLRHDVQGVDQWKPVNHKNSLASTWGLEGCLEVLLSGGREGEMEEMETEGAGAGEVIVE